MKKIYLILIISIFIFNKSYSETVKDCSKLDKLSTKYIECQANKAKEKTTEFANKKKKDFEKSGLKDKLIKFKNSKTLSEFIKKK
tara:strand:+ start:259 stop:513 length:255 start_codon:yes stop_codon:yes gene_type:complete